MHELMICSIKRKTLQVASIANARCCRANLTATGEVRGSTHKGLVLIIMSVICTVTTPSLNFEGLNFHGFEQLQKLNQLGTYFGGWVCSLCSSDVHTC